MNKHISKDEKVQQSKNMIKNFELSYTSYNHGLHWKIPVDNYIINFYPTTHTWYDSCLERKGKGIESFLIYIGKKEPEGE
jgi:hypothetical protein